MAWAKWPPTCCNKKATRLVGGRIGPKSFPHIARSASPRTLPRLPTCTVQATLGNKNIDCIHMKYFTVKLIIIYILSISSSPMISSSHQMGHIITRFKENKSGDEHVLPKEVHASSLESQPLLTGISWGYGMDKELLRCVFVTRLPWLYQSTEVSY